MISHGNAPPSSSRLSRMSDTSATKLGSAIHYDEGESLATVADFVDDPDPSPWAPNCIEKHDYDTNEKVYIHYTRLRFSQRAGFRDWLRCTDNGKLHWEDIRRREEVIRDFRAPTGKKPTGKGISTEEKDTRFQTLSNLRQKWRRTAHEELEKRRKSIDERVQKEKKDNVPHDQRKWNDERIEDAHHVLDRVGSEAWMNRLSESEPREEETVIDPNKYLRGYLININKNGGSYEFKRLKPDLTLDDLQGQAETPLQTTSKSPCSPNELHVNTRIEPYILPQGNSKSSPSAEQSKRDVIRYIHLPANNMDWVEETIALLCDEERGNHDLKTIPERKVEHILRPEYWRGQQRGGPEDPVHGRHMRSQCSLLPSSLCRQQDSILSPGSDADASIKFPPIAFGSSHNHFAIFMPYLHWESDRSRAQMAEVIKQATNERRAKERKEGNSYLKDFQDEVVKAIEAKYRASTGIAKKEPCDLGAYLMEVARVFISKEEYEGDERLLRYALHHKAPIHIRRTLDQSYYCTLEDTSERDRDQVIYRATKSSGNARVVMVDQLWMWILDERLDRGSRKMPSWYAGMLNVLIFTLDTIITSFPRRWGRNKGDESGVHKCLRDRLACIRENEINNIWDIALIIIDQCSRVFFDRTLSQDKRPEVIDTFANAIGNVTGMKTTAFEAFWQSITPPRSTNPKTLGVGDINRAQLNINPEGKLLKETQDIGEELRLMGDVFDQQLQMATKFNKALKRIFDSQVSEEKVVPEDLDGPLDLANALRILLRPPNRPENPTVLPSNLYRASDLVEEITARRAKIQHMEEAASRTCRQLKDLLNLKQQQTSILDTKLSLERATESVRQGRSIMTFTVVTILFLPLGFISSIFGMNAQEINGTGSLMHLHQQLTYIFSVSAAIIVICLSVAFSTHTRELNNLLAGLLKIGWSYIVVFSGSQKLLRFLKKTRYEWLKKKEISPQTFDELEQRHVKEIYGRHDRKSMEKAMKMAEDIKRRREEEERQKEETPERMV